MTITVGVDADCTLEGFVDWSLLSPSGYAYYEDWNRLGYQVIEHPRRARFTLSWTFTEATIGSVAQFRAITMDQLPGF